MFPIAVRKRTQLGNVYKADRCAMRNTNLTAADACRRRSPAYTGHGAGIRQEPRAPAAYATVIILVVPYSQT